MGHNTPEINLLFSQKFTRSSQYIGKNVVVMETEYRIDNNQNNSNIVNNDTTEENSHLKSEQLTTNNTSIVSDTEVKTAENLVLEANKYINK